MFKKYTQYWLKNTKTNSTSFLADSVVLITKTRNQIFKTFFTKKQGCIIAYAQRAGKYFIIDNGKPGGELVFI